MDAQEQARSADERRGGIILMFVVLYAFFGRIYDAFLVSLKRVSEMFYS